MTVLDKVRMGPPLGNHNRRTHGLSYYPDGTRSREYGAWKNMIRRCTDPTLQQWSNYGGRGITVCDRWLHSVTNFCVDMGKCPDGFTLDRIDNDGNYEPSNCRWATRKEQSANKSHCSTCTCLETA